MTFDIERLYEAQLASWPLAAANYAALEKCRRLTVDVAGVDVEVRFNTERIRSSAAAVDRKSIESRPCFLCRDNRPKEQIMTETDGYDILVNPYPVFRRHLTIAAVDHTPQALAGRISDMLRFAGLLPGMTVFYNGPRSGASAPDHLHFQAVPSDELPLWKFVDQSGEWPLTHAEIVSGTDAGDVARPAEGYIWNLSPGEEPDMNVYARVLPDGSFQIAVIPRRRHRPTFYGAGENQALVSPASVEMAGVIVAPRGEDFAFCSRRENIERIFSECGAGGEGCGRGSERRLRVGIVRAAELDVDFEGRRLHFKALPDGTMECDGKIYSEPLELVPADPESAFTLRNVMIGIGFHWQQHEDQSFHGTLTVVPGQDAMLQAINTVDVETYLRSVVSSEMNASAPEEFLKAHAVISRSWVMAQVMPPAHLSDHEMTCTDSETVKWYDRDAHTGFDICADDHCQRYQGCTKASTPQVEAALQATCGQVLAFDNDLCDARFSKCCGGVTELFSTCWQPVDLPYLKAVDDPYCGRASEEVLRTVLNDYDRTTTDYYRWTVEYTAGELRDIIARRSGTDYGDIISITPLHRGPSGRIDRLEIRGTGLRRIIGKELEIRRTLSESHLYSSAFDVEASGADSDGIPRHWKFHGRGWGHGVGLCQIGAAVMAAEGCDYRQILDHYFPGARLITIY